MLGIIKQIKCILLKKRWKLVVAESLTGGLCQSTLVECPGISQIFLGGIVSYNNEIKNKILNVDNDILLNKTAVSKETAEQMSKGVQKLFEADVAISFTGEAGPFSQVGELGQVFISIVINDKVYTHLLQLRGERNYIRQQAVQEGLKFLLSHLQELH